MKKIYLSIATIALSVSAIAQNQFMTTGINNDKAPYVKKGTKATEQSIARTAAGVIKGRFDPGYALITANGVLNSEIGQTGKVGVFVDPIFADSTVKYSFPASASDYVSTIKFGTTFDPKSIIYDQVNFTPLLSSTDSYYVDTLWIGGVYQRKTAVNDTLLIEMVWGDTTNTSVFGLWSYAGGPAYMGTFATPKHTTIASQLQGSAAFLSAPVSNKITVRYVLTDADTLTLNNQSYLPIVVAGTLGQLIPANNIVSTNVTFISGEPTYSVGTCIYSVGAATLAATSNGFAGIVYQQRIPAQPVAGSNYFDDFLKGKNYSTFLTNRARYGTDSFTAFLRGAISLSYFIDYSIHTTTVVATAAKEVTTKGFALGQNVPNPYSGTSVVSYSLAKDASSALFTVTDVMGRVLTSEKANTTTGTHSVKLGSYPAGIYYYSLNVDGKTSTHKMIVE